MASITLRPSAESRNEKVGLDWWLLGAAVLLSAIGLASIFSAVIGTKEAGEFKKQFMFILLGFIPTSVFAFCHPRLWARAANFVYGINLALLVAVLAVGKNVNGAERWINIAGFQFQPSEMSKVLIVLTLASFYASRQDRIKEFSTFAIGGLHVFVPVGLIMQQPHLGASLLIISVWVALSLVAGVSPKYMLFVIGSLVILSTLVFKFPSVRYKVITKYQWERVIGLLGIESDDPTVNPSGKSLKDKQLQVRMASYAFANGGVAGTGYLKGDAKKRVPFVGTDFIFACVGEEFGMMGCIALLGVYALLFYRIWLGMLSAADLYYQLIMAGILTIFGFHVIVNAGMVLGVLPVVGMWLPFMSYGGTAIWLCMSLVGLALNVRARERAVLF